MLNLLCLYFFAKVHSFSYLRRCCQRECYLVISLCSDIFMSIYLLIFFPFYSKVDEYGFERAEDFDYESYEEFMSQYLPILARRARKWARLMGNPNSLKRGPVIKRFMRKGVPAEHRAEVVSQIVQKIS